MGRSDYAVMGLAGVNNAGRGIDLQSARGDAKHEDPGPEAKAGCLLAYLPFTDSNWWSGIPKGHKRRVSGVRPAGNVSCACVQLFIRSLAPRTVAGLPPASTSTTRNWWAEGQGCAPELAERSRLGSCIAIEVALA